jgi:hypothetical protein
MIQYIIIILVNNGHVSRVDKRLQAPPLFETSNKECERRLVIIHSWINSSCNFKCKMILGNDFQRPAKDNVYIHSYQSVTRTENQRTPNCQSSVTKGGDVNTNLCVGVTWYQIYLKCVTFQVISSVTILQLFTSTNNFLRSRLHYPSGIQ